MPGRELPAAPAPSRARAEQRGLRVLGRSISTTRGSTRPATRRPSSSRSWSRTRSRTCRTRSTIFQDDGAAGRRARPGRDRERASSRRSTRRSSRSGPREVDGSPEGEYNTRHAHRPHAARLQDHVEVPGRRLPVQPARERQRVLQRRLAAQTARGVRPTARARWPTAYVVTGWPQTIAITDDPDTNFDPQNPIDLRAFLTIVGTREDTTVQVTTTARVVGGGPVPETPEGGSIEVKLGAFDVLNLESGGFNADFTGSIVKADRADRGLHRKRGLGRAPLRRARGSPLLRRPPGGSARSDPHRRQAVRGAAHAEPVADGEGGRRADRGRARAGVRPDRGGQQQGRRDRDDPAAAGRSDHAVDAGRVPRGDGVGRLRRSRAPSRSSCRRSWPARTRRGSSRALPGGDPSLIILPPIEQFRPDYVFLTPDKYAFDFISVVAPRPSVVRLDDVTLGPDECEIAPADGLTEEQRGAARRRSSSTAAS